MSEFSEKVSAIKESMKDHVFSPPTGDELANIVGDSHQSDESSNNNFDDASNDNDFGDNSNDNVQSSDNFIEEPHAPKKKSSFRGRSDKNRLEARLEKAAYEKDLYLSQNRELMARVQEQERLLAENQYRAAQNEQQRDAYYEDNLGTKEQSILQALKVAKEEGDIDREVSLSHELSKIAAEKSTYDLYKNQISQQPQQQNNYPVNNNRYVEPYSPYQNQVEPQNEHLENWLENNPWADPESRNYSPRLREEVQNIASELDDLLRYDGSAHVIGTPEYFSSLDNLMRERYSIDGAKPVLGQTQPARRMEQQHQMKDHSSSRSVAPVNRNGSSMADQYMSNNRNNTRQSIRLTQEEYNIARNLQIRLPNGNTATPEEAIRRYAENKRLENDGRDDRHPHRIIID